MDSLTKLTKLFERFPGIGPRQAERFVHFLLRSSPSLRRELADAIHSLNASVKQCAMCMRFHDGAANPCVTCTSPKRNGKLLMIVATDSDRTAIEQSRNYDGHYFIYGGTVSLASENNPHLRGNDLVRIIKERGREDLTEVVLAFPANPEGDATALHVRDELSTLTDAPAFKITMLGRGLSTGSEIEYADSDTIKNALDNRR